MTAVTAHQCGTSYVHPVLRIWIRNEENLTCVNLYLLSPSKFNKYYDNIDKWVNIVKNKQIDLQQYKVYKILKSVEENCPNMPRPFI